MKRYRPRFSIRTLVILITLVCCYAACWGPTTREGVKDAARHVFYQDVYSTKQTPEVNDWLREQTRSGARATAPLVIQYVPIGGSRCYYYFWFFGYVAKLPYTRDMDMKEREQLWAERYPDIWPASPAPW